MRNIDDLCADAIWWARYGNLGYDQGDRYTWESSGYSTGKEVDCSSFVRGLLKKNGFEVGGFTYTGNESSELCKHGWIRVANDGNPHKGDILLNDSHHTALYVGNGQVAQASRGEAGHRVSGGRAGDQDGYETNVRSYYNYPWTCYLRYVGAQQAPQPAKPGGRFSLAVDGWLGPETARAMEIVFAGTDFGDRRISSQPRPNGAYWPCNSGGIEFIAPSRAKGSTTMRALQKAVIASGHSVGSSGADSFAGRDTVYGMQGMLAVKQDHYAGPETCKALQRYLNARA